MNARILLVADDSPEVIDVVTRTLEDAGFRALSANTVRDALGLDALERRVREKTAVRPPQ